MELVMKDLLFQDVIDAVSDVYGLPTRISGFGCVWDRVEMLYIGGTITLESKNPNNKGKYIINSIKDTTNFLLGVINEGTDELIKGCMEWAIANNM